MADYLTNSERALSLLALQGERADINRRIEILELDLLDAGDVDLMIEARIDSLKAFAAQLNKTIRQLTDGIMGSI